MLRACVFVCVCACVVSRFRFGGSVSGWGCSGYPDGWRAALEARDFSRGRLHATEQIWVVPMPMSQFLEFVTLNSCRQSAMIVAGYRYVTWTKDKTEE